MPLLNITNHPSKGWSPNQKKAAQRYGKVLDIPFPKVDPLATTEEIQQLARELFFKILTVASTSVDEPTLQGKNLRKDQGKINQEKTTVHLMGEMTLTYALLRLLKEEGILAIASTTERKVTMHEDGSRQIMFNFQKFRAYW